jgi:hypothetical protein
VEDASRTGAPAGSRLAELLRHLEVRSQSGRRDGVPALLRRALGRGLQGEHGLQSSDLPERRAAADADPVHDPSSHPADKLKILQTANEWHAVFGYPGPAGPAPDEVANSFIIPDMMANAATDKMTPEEAVAWAEKQIQGIYKKWMT